MSISAEIQSTESRERVLKALENLFPGVEFKENDTTIECSISDKKGIIGFKELLKRQQIRTSARAFMLEKAEDNHLSFGLSKQAAYVGKISFVDFDVALGPITIEVTEKSPEKLELFIEWLCG